MIELLIAVAIVAILCTLAWPNYAEYASRARRTRAQLDLTEAAQYLQRYYATFNAYTDAVLPDALARSPHDGQAAYAISVAVDADGCGFTLSAAPQGAYASDRCGSLSLRSTGQRGNAAGQALDSCWR